MYGRQGRGRGRGRGRRPAYVNIQQMRDEMRARK